MPETPNTFAYIATIAWFFIPLLFYKYMPVVNATFWTIVGGFLILPAKFAIDFPLIPPLGKETMLGLIAFIGCKYIKKIKIHLIPKAGIAKWLTIVFLISPFFTAINNQEVSHGLPGLTYHDAISLILNRYLQLLPFIVGMQVVKTYDDQLLLFKLLVISGLIYSLPILFEIRMSPQLHTWIYGYFPHNFGQQIRFGGFRAVVFIGHGLLVSMYIAIVLAASTILLKQKIKILGISQWMIIIYFIVILILNKTVSGFILGLLLFIAIAWMKTGLIRQLSLFFTYIFMLYPALCALDLFPHEQLVQIAMDLNQEKGGSLATRFYYENILIHHAQEKLFFGWGGWGRNLLEGVLKDGYWIGIFGIYGLVGYYSLMGFCFLSVVRAAKSSIFLEKTNEQHLLVSHALIVSIMLIDQIPNSSFDDMWIIFLIGTLLGRANTILLEKKASQNEILSGHANTIISENQAARNKTLQHSSN